MTADEQAPPKADRLFYVGLIGEAELREALDVQGLDLEVALLRSKMREYVLAHPKEYELMLKSVTVIVRTVATRYRISDKRAKDFASAAVAMLDAVGSQFE